MEIKIRDYKYTIKEVEKEEKDFHDENGELQLYGQTIYGEQVIKIYKHLKKERKRQTLIHELTHAFMDAYLNSQHIKDKFDEEDICCFLATYVDEIMEIVNRYKFEE